MGSPYTSTSVSGYNSNPPPDDGTTVSTNKITWAGIKTKLGDPLNTFASALNTVLVSSFSKTIDGGTLVTTAVNYAMTSADQGRFIKATVSGITITTPDAGTVLSPFVFVVSNQSTGTITIAGNATGGQTVDGQTTQVIKAGSGCLVFTDGVNWFTSGLKAAQLQSTNPPYGFDSAVNLQLNASVASNLLTIAVKTNSGNDPTPGDPVLIPVRDSSGNLGDVAWVAVTSALSINTNAVGATLGSTSNNAFRFWIVAFNNSGTAVLALINCLNPTTANIFPLNDRSIQSATGISAAATSVGTFYCPNGTTITGKCFCVLGYIEYFSTGLPTAGTYSLGPSLIQLAGPHIPRPGYEVQRQFNFTGANASGTTVFSTTNTAPTNTGGDQYMSQAITPTSAANVLDIDHVGNWTASAGVVLGVALFQDSTATTLSSQYTSVGGNLSYVIPLKWAMQAGTAASTTFKIRAGGGSGTTAFNGGPGTPKYGGTIGSYLQIREIMA